MMIVRDFLRWLDSAPASERAEAAGILARTYLCSDLEADAIAVAEDLMLKLVDDPSPLVRRALADALAASPLAPPVVVMALTADQPQIAAPVYALSPLLVDADLLDAVATGGEMIQVAIASRAVLPSVVAAALAELGNAEACLILTENHAAEIAPSAIERMVERFGDDAAIRAALLARDDLPAAIRQNLVTKVSETIAGFCCRPVLAGGGSRPPHYARSLRQGNRNHCRRKPQGGASPAGPPSLRQWPTHRRPHVARALIRQSCSVRRRLGGIERHAGAACWRTRAGSFRCRLAGFVEEGTTAAFDACCF